MLAISEEMVLLASIAIVILGSWLGGRRHCAPTRYTKSNARAGSALPHIFVKLIGFGVGPVAIALLTETLFHPDESIDKSLMLTIAVCGATGASLFACVLRPYRNLLVESCLGVNWNTRPVIPRSGDTLVQLPSEL
jgi:hypothetical protein